MRKQWGKYFTWGADKMITIVGLGPGQSKYLTNEAIAMIESASVIYGAKRHIDIISDIKTKASKSSYVKLGELSAMISESITKGYENIAVLASGDPSLYGIAKYLMDKFAGEDKQEVEIIPGISSVAYLFSKIKQSMNDIYITSTHGKDLSFDTVINMDKVAYVTDSNRGPVYIANRYLDAGLDPYIIVGENLAYENERITLSKASKLDKEKYYDMNVVIVIKEDAYER